MINFYRSVIEFLTSSTVWFGNAFAKNIKKLNAYVRNASYLIDFILEPPESITSNYIDYRLDVIRYPVRCTSNHIEFRFAKVIE